jgi:hypothetical protein
MKRILLALVATVMTMCAFAQTDTSGVEKVDTIRIGGMVIIKKKGKNTDKGEVVEVTSRKDHKQSKISTNWIIVDLGFANFNDRTDYGSAEAQAFAPGTGKDAFKLRTGKSVNVNIWLFMQKLNIAGGYLNLKYGLGVELNNYRFENKQLRFTTNPTTAVLDPQWNNLVKNKLAADYVTVPIMLNVNLTPGRSRGFGFSAGISAGYLYSARQKIKDNDGNKTKFYSDFELNRFKLSYIGELNLGPVKLYGSYAFKSMWSKGLDQVPYTFGIRLSNW